MSRPAPSKSSRARSTAPSARPPSRRVLLLRERRHPVPRTPARWPTMTHTVCVKLAPILTAERWDDPKWMRPDRVFYWPGSLKLIPRQANPDRPRPRHGRRDRHRHRTAHDALHRWGVDRRPRRDRRSARPGCGSTERRRRSATGTFTRLPTSTGRRASPPRSCKRSASSVTSRPPSPSPRSSSSNARQPQAPDQRPERPRYPRATRSSTPRPAPSSADPADRYSASGDRELT